MLEQKSKHYDMQGIINLSIFTIPEYWHVGYANNEMRMKNYFRMYYLQSYQLAF